MSWKLDDGVANRIRITAGNARLQFKTGPVVVVSAPATVEAKAPQLLVVNRGKAKVVVPRDAIGFTVTTPRARIVDLGTEFRVDVDNSGATSTTVDKGAVTFEARLETGGFTQPVKLTPAGLSRASAAMSNFAKDVPYISTIATGVDGSFDATVHSQGKSAAFRAPADYEGFLESAKQAAQSNPGGLRENWSEILESPAANSGSSVESTDSPPSVSGGPNSDRPRTAVEANARAARLEQLRWMQQQQPNNPAIQAMIDSIEQENKQDN